MGFEIITSIIATSSTIILAGSTYWFTKKREREAEIRKEKLEHYKDFVASLSGNIDGEDSEEGQRNFSLACNKLNLIAPLPVIKALQNYQQEIKITNKNKTQESHDRLMSKLFYEIRKDLLVTPKDKNENFIFGLWSAFGLKPRKK